MARRSRIARGTVLALARVTEGGRVIGVEPSTTVGLLVDVLGPALADRSPMPRLDLRPLDLDAGVGQLDLAGVRMRVRPIRAPLLTSKTERLLSSFT
jgi:hypothetical protein